MRKLIFALMAIISTVAMQSQSMSRIDVLYYPNSDLNNAPTPYLYPDSKAPFHGVIYDTLRTDSTYTIELYGIDLESGNRVAWGVPYGIQPTGTHYWVFGTYVHQPELSDSLMSLKSWILSKGYITNTTIADSTEALRDEMSAYIKTEADPTIYPWAKASTKPSYSFSEIGSKPTTLSGYGITDAYPLTGNPSGFLTSVPAQSWASITGKPTFATVATSGSYNDLTNKPTIPTVATQYGTTYTKEWNGKVTTTASTNEYTFNISSAGFSSITSIQATGFYNGATTTTAPIVAIKSYSTSSVTVVIAESANTNVLLGGTVEGLTDFLKAGEVFITVKGN